MIYAALDQVVDAGAADVGEERPHRRLGTHRQSVERCAGCQLPRGHRTFGSGKPVQQLAYLR